MKTSLQHAWRKGSAGVYALALSLLLVFAVDVHAATAPTKAQAVAAQKQVDAQLTSASAAIKAAQSQSAIISAYLNGTTTTPPAGPGQSADGTTVTSVNGGPIYNAALKPFTITAGAQYSISGTIVPSSEGVVKLQYCRSIDRVDQLNAKNVWWTAPADGSAGANVASACAGIPPPPTGPVVTPPKVTIPADMISFAGKTMIPGQFDQDWNPSTWQNGVTPFNPLFASINQGTLILHQDSTGSSEVQANEGALFTNGLYEIYASYDADVSGNVIAPLWLYHTPGEVFEIDFEVAGKNGNQLRLHAPIQPAGQVYVKIIPGTYNAPHRWGIRYKAGSLIAWYLDGVLLAQITPADVPAGQFPSAPLKVFMSNWAAGNDGWTGPWTPQTINFYAYAWKFTPGN